jgi:hypothetical protein
MCSIYNATGVPDTNMLILCVFQNLSILECTVLCAVVHNFLCKKERSCCFIEGRLRFSGRFQCI